MARYGMIMAGGLGTRLWPMSRRDKPKQLLPFINGKTLLELAVQRLEGVVPPENRLICTAESSRDAIRAILPDFTDEQIIGEPTGRDTVNAIGLVAAILLKRDPDAVFLVITADHLIKQRDTFASAAEQGFAIVDEDPSRFITFAIEPTYPSDGFGYLEHGDPVPNFPGAMFAKRVHEKPEKAKAEEFLAAGNFSWNSGIFIFGAGKFLDVLKLYMEKNAIPLFAIGAHWDTPKRQRMLEEVYPTLEKKSVDYAIMEPASRDGAAPICIVPMRVDWLDVGSWPAFGATLEESLGASHDGNLTNAHACHHKSTGILAVSDDPNHTIATVDCHDLIVIRTADATLVCPRAKAEQIKDLVAKLNPSLQ